MLQEIFTKYKERLVNISGRNRSLVMKHLYKKSAFDFSRLNQFTPMIDQQIIEFLTGRKKGKLQLIEDPYRWQEQMKREINQSIEKEMKERLKAVESLKIANLDKQQKKEMIRQTLNDSQMKKLEKAKKTAENMMSDSQSLTYLLREIEATEKETGRYELYIGYPFVEGYFKDKTFVKAPLLMYPVHIFKSGDTWYLENIQDQNVTLNKVFLMGFIKYNETMIGNIPEEIEDTWFSEKNLKSSSGIAAYLNEYNITVKAESAAIVEKFREHTKDTPIEYSPGELTIRTYLIAGQFPVANSIYNDYVELEKSKEKQELLNHLLLTGAGKDSNRLAFYDGSNEIEEIAEQDMYLMTSLDFSQERAVQAVQKTNQLVVYGPPGTGKSQTIVNIISDNLSKGKKILMVSQKKTALDVIYSRISSIQSKFILVHDINKDKKFFYDKIADQLENLSKTNKITTQEAINQKSTAIDQKIKSLNLLAERLTIKRENGISLQEMYNKSKKIMDRNDFRYTDFKKFRTTDFWKNNSYEEIQAAVQEISCKNLISRYCTYRKYLTDNSLILQLKQDLDVFLIDDSIDKIVQLFDKYENKISWPFGLQDPLVKALIVTYEKNGYHVEKEAVFQLAEEINYQENGELLQKLNDGRWWSLLYWLHYSKNKAQEEINLQTYQAFHDELKQKLINYHNQMETVLKDIHFIQEILSLEPKSYYSILFENHDLSEYVRDLQASLKIYEKYRNIVSTLQGLPRLQMDILEYLYNQGTNEVFMSSLLNQIPEFFLLFHIGKIEQAEREILGIHKEFDNLTSEIQKLMQEKQALIPRHILSVWDSRFTEYSSSEQKRIKELRRQANKKRQLWPIRKCLREFDDLLLTLFPCWLLSPETVSEILPVKVGIFDLIIFDEASQMFVENAIPTIYRGKSVVVAGDDKQLRPSSTFKVKIDSDEETEELETAAALEEESLLDLAKVNYDPAYLCYHYRAFYDELINFSNYGFYQGRLEVSPNIVRSGSEMIKPIERIKVDGRWINKQNIVEAEKVVHLISDLLLHRKNDETIGIITFNMTQKDLIDDMLDAKADKDSVFREMYRKEKERKKENEDMGLFVRNIENVQGDERDIIIFSTGYGKNENNRFSVNFGSLSQDGGENRLNVAISRAKRKIYVVTSFEPEELNVEQTKNNGPKLLKKYMQYVRDLSEGNHEAVINLLNSLLDTDLSREKTNHFDSGFEEEVYERLKQRGYEVDTQVGVSGYKIDLAIYDAKQSKYIIGIECDGAAYHSSKSARERDLFRQKYLESRGWKILRIWSKDWWENPSQEIDRIDQYLKNAGQVL